MFDKIFKKEKKLEKVVHLPVDRFSFMPQDEQTQFQDDVSQYFQKNYPEFIIDFSKAREKFLKSGYGREQLKQFLRNTFDNPKRGSI